MNITTGYIVRLMSNVSPDLPEFIDPWRAVARAQHYQGRIAVQALPRVRALLADSGGDVAFSLDFERHAARVVVRVAVRAELRLHCQRCFEALPWSIDEQASLAVVQGLDEAAALPDDYDPLLLDESLLRPLQLIEDEVLLAIPTFPRHPESDCPVALPVGESPLDEAEAVVLPPDDAKSQADSPFAVLAQWKTQGR
ncbi:YceD family protein [Rhabdochromatium marinum]|uniref:YceD family protein n=1 Tax=Rhabdochromatium marinum TaxID=48729 RepID=UPI0019085067|nr:YceD family protein [Rhabdochromatium marinum]